MFNVDVKGEIIMFNKS